MTQTQTATATPELLACVNPATGESLGTVPAHTPDDVRGIVQRAHEVQRTWASTSFEKRRRVLQTLLGKLMAHTDELVDTVIRDSGKTRENAMLGEIWPIAEKIRWTIAKGEDALKPERVSSGLLLHKRAMITYPPRGVIGIISPWNYPLQNILGPSIPALFAGNSVIVKISEHVAWSAERFRFLWEETFEEHGLPKDLIQLVHGDGRVGATLINAGVDLVVFTGSMANGKKVLATSAETLTPTILELGGKDAFVVLDDAPLEAAAYASLIGSYLAAGQNCMAAERTLVQDAVYEEFVERVRELAVQLRQGVPTEGAGTVDVGALVTPMQRDLVQKLVDDAVAKGAKAIVGGKPGGAQGNFFEPTVLIDCTPDMDIMQEETFGPIMAIMKVGDDEDVIRVANGTPFGLSLTVYSSSDARARYISDNIDTGNVSINDFAMTYMVPDLPFGGVKGSGFGRLNGREGLRAVTKVRGVLEDRLMMGLPPKIYPVNPADYGMARGLIRTIYGRNVGQKLSGVKDLAGGALRRLTGK